MAIRRVLLLPLLSCGLFATQAAAQGVYKWIDADGRAHFGSAPPAGAAGRKLDLPPTPGNVATTAKSWQDQLESSNLKRHLTQKAEDKAGKDAAQRCQSARQTAALLERERPIYRVNAQGEREYLEDGQRQAAHEAARQRIASDCR